jgi:hypothetical protein
MHRRHFFEVIAAAASVQAGQTPATKAGFGNYPNNRTPLLPGKYVKLPLGASKPSGWLRDQLIVQKHGLTTHLPNVWDVARESGWKGDAGKNVLPECCVPRFVPRWLEGVNALAAVLDDKELKAVGEPYMQFLLNVTDLASVSPSLTSWSHLGRSLPEYYEYTGDKRAIRLTRAILDYADKVKDVKDPEVVAGHRLGMLLSFGWWYYNQTGDEDVPALIERCTKRCVDDWKKYYTTFPNDPKYFVKFPDVTAQKGPDHHPRQWTRHVVDVTQAIQYPVMYYLMNKDESYRDSVLTGMKYLDMAYGQVGARWAGDEFMASTDPTAGTELCSIEEVLYCYERNFEVLGELEFADRIEQLMFNGFPGTCTADMWAHQYDQQANQVLVSEAYRPWHLNNDSSNIYGFTPNYACCVSNMHSPWPRYVEHMWMATEDDGLVKALYGPGRVKAKVADGIAVEIIEETEYPFSDKVRLRINPSRPAQFPIYFRIPKWSPGAVISLGGGALDRNPDGGTLHKLERLWKPGDIVELDFRFKVRTEARPRNNAIAVAWGPLYFVLRIGEAFTKLPGLVLQRSPEMVPTPEGAVDWRIAPTTDWNYALKIDRENPQVEFVKRKIGTMPFAQKSEPVRLPGASEFTPWQDDVPIVLKVKAHQVPSWGMNGHNAAPVPVSPVKVETPERVVELIPYGCSRLRIAEFPTL